MFFSFSQSTFANRLHDLRKTKGLTLEQLGNEIDSTRATLSNFETGKKRPSLDMVIKLSEYFNVSIDYLVGRTEECTLFQKKRDL